MTGPIHTTGTWPTTASGPYPMPSAHMQQTPQSPARRGKTWMWATVIVAAIAFTGLCAGLGAGLASRHPSEPTAAATAPVTDAERHQQDVNLCTTYAIANASSPRPITTGNDLLPGRMTVLRALDDNPDASPEIRQALADMADSWLSQAGTATRRRGLAVPPPFDEHHADELTSRAWHLCGLDE